MAEYKDWQRSYLGYHERFVESFSLRVCTGAEVTVLQAPTPGKAGADCRQEGDSMVTGTTVWDAGIMLAQFIAGDNIVTTTLPTPCTVLELGAGTGLVSLALAASGLAANFVVTDLPSMVNFVEQNIQRNAAVLKRAGGVLSICAEGLRWANEEDIAMLKKRHGETFDLILAADVLYSEQTPQGQLMLDTFKAVCSPRTQVIVAAHKLHNAGLVDKFIADARTVFESVEDITDLVPGEWQCEAGVLLRLSLLLDRPA